MRMPNVSMSEAKVPPNLNHIYMPRAYSNLQIKPKQNVHQSLDVDRFRSAINTTLDNLSQA